MCKALLFKEKITERAAARQVILLLIMCYLISKPPACFSESLPKERSATTFLHADKNEIGQTKKLNCR